MAPTSFPVTTFTQSPSLMVGGIVYVGALVAASISDVRSRRISNRLVIALTLCGIVYGLLTQDPSVGLARALLGFAIGFALWIPFYAMGMLGAGDVKLFAAASSWLAPSQIFGAALLSALAGGVLSIAGLMLAHGIGLTTFRIAHAVKNPRLLATPLPVPAGRRTLPYGLAMAVGLAVVGWFPKLLRLQ
jgi:prepilin peptidase CpaA